MSFVPVYRKQLYSVEEASLSTIRMCNRVFFVLIFVITCGKLCIMQHVRIPLTLLLKKIHFLKISGFNECRNVLFLAVIILKIIPGY